MAEPLFKEAVDSRVETLGKDHTETIEAMEVYANCLGAQGLPDHAARIREYYRSEPHDINNSK